MSHKAAARLPEPQNRLSPDGSLQLELLVSEWSVSLWTHAPRVTDIATGQVLFDLWGTSWDAQAAWIGDNGLRLDLRRYDHAGAITLLLDFPRGTYRLDADGKDWPLASVNFGMEVAFDRAHRHYLDSLALGSAAEVRACGPTAASAPVRADLAGLSVPKRDPCSAISVVTAVWRAARAGKSAP